MEDKKIYNDEALRTALRREQERIRMPEGLTERVMKRIDPPLTLPCREGVVTIQELSSSHSKQKTLLRVFYAAAAVLIFAFIVIGIRSLLLREGGGSAFDGSAFDLALYEGSYTIENGQRTDDLRAIRADIRSALAMADAAESNAPQASMVRDVEQTMLHATDDPELRATIQQMLNE